jgi:protein-disulfide isomerase
MSLLRRSGITLLATVSFAAAVYTGIAAAGGVSSSGPGLLSSLSLGSQAVAAGPDIEALVRREVQRQIPDVLREVVERSSPVAIEKWVRENPEKIAEALSAMIQKQQKAVSDEAEARVHAVEDTLFHAEVVPVAGNPNGRIEIVYFFDVNCVFCKQMDPRLTKLIAENPDVKVIHREVGILGPGSEYAAAFDAGIWTLAKDRYFAIHAAQMARKAVFRTKEEVDAFMVEQLGKEKAAEIEAAVLSQEGPSNAVHLVNANLATAAGLTGTPFVYVRKGEIFRGLVDDTALGNAVAKARAAL